MDDVPGVFTHDAPPPYRPLSGLAVTAFVLSLVFGLAAFAGISWPAAVPFAFAAFSFAGISAGRRRGRGLAIAALVISILAAVGGWRYAVQMRETFEAPVGRLVEALDRGETEEVRRSVVADSDAERDATAARWLESFAAAEREAGAYDGAVEVVSSLWAGPMLHLFVPPPGVEEVGDAERKPFPLGTALWLRAHFRGKPLWVAGSIVRGEKPDSASSAQVQSLAAGRATFYDLRFYRERARTDPEPAPR